MTPRLVGLPELLARGRGSPALDLQPGVFGPSVPTLSTEETPQSGEGAEGESLAFSWEDLGVGK